MEKRAFSLDALRGYAIITMVLSATVLPGILPQWMYHSQTPPPDHIYDMSISGLTWVDLVFPFFLFAMGAAFPFSLGSRLRKGVGCGTLVKDTVLRWLELAFFAIFIQHFYPYVLSSTQDWRSMLSAMAAFALLFPMFMRFRRLPEWGGVAVKAGAYAVATVLLATTTYAGGRTFDVHFSNIIILILSNMALYGGLCYVFTADKPRVRSFLWVAVLVLVLGAEAQESWCAAFLGFAPIDWLLRFDYMRYLLILIPASFAGEYLSRSMKADSAGERCRLNDFSGAALALLSVAAVVGTLWSINHHHLACAFGINAAFAVAAHYIVRKMSGSYSALWYKLLRMAFGLMMLGLVAEALQGGVKKDPATVSYLLVTSALALYALVFFSVVCDYFGCRKSTAFLTESGQNPMIAYVAGDLLVYPLLSMTGLAAFSKVFYASPWLGFLHGVILTALSVLITMFFTRRKLFWRT